MMTGLAIDMLENNRLASVIGQVEEGEEVDIDRVLALQSLDAARAGQLFLVDALKREDEADEQFEHFVSGLT